MRTAAQRHADAAGGRVPRAYEIDRVALVDDGTEYGRQTTRFLDAGLRGNGRTVLAETVREGARDLDAEAGRIAAKRPGPWCTEAGGGTPDGSPKR